ncbi:MAG: glycosyl transferase family 2 [Flavobacteriaceae bacterium]|nr:glycosyl transferase family 2 [Flavobacteriaceae bacterium]|tara:strand:- start:323 stop:1207 length:885 start_codon:yes stop_codon:yes gene_type:complete
MPWIEKCLQSCGDHSIVVVDNNSSDRTVSSIQQHFPKVKVLSQNENLGFGQANNLGITYALNNGAEYVFLLNQDAYLEQGGIEKLIEIHKCEPELGILSPVHLNGSGRLLDRNFSYYLGYDNNANFYSDAIFQRWQRFYEVPFVNAAAWLLPKSTLLKVGGFDPLFFHYGEDDNYCQRLRFHNLKIAVVPAVYIKHDREDRLLKNAQRNSANQVIEYERKIKLLYADVNSERIREVPIKIKKLALRRKKALLTGKWQHAEKLRQERELYEKLYPDMEISYTTNQKIGSHYLGLS